MLTHAQLKIILKNAHIIWNIYYFYILIAECDFYCSLSNFQKTALHSVENLAFYKEKIPIKLFRFFNKNLYIYLNAHVNLSKNSMHKVQYV